MPFVGEIPSLMLEEESHLLGLTLAYSWMKVLSGQNVVHLPYGGSVVEGLILKLYFVVHIESPLVLLLITSSFETSLHSLRFDSSPPN